MTGVRFRSKVSSGEGAMVELASDQRWRCLADVSQALAEATNDLDSVLRLVATRAVELLGDGGAVFLATADEAWLEPVAFDHRDPAGVAVLRSMFATRPYRVSDEDALSQVFRSGRAQLIAQGAADLEEQKPEYAEFFERFPLRSLLMVPLRARGRTIGVLAMARHADGHGYTEEDEEFLQELADRAALGIANARLLAESERRVRQLGALRA